MASQTNKTNNNQTDFQFFFPNCPILPRELIIYLLNFFNFETLLKMKTISKNHLFFITENFNHKIKSFRKHYEKKTSNVS